MAFSDIFNTSFFILLGIILLGLGLLVLYYENKMRDQNHKIQSMLDLVSVLANEMNTMKMSQMFEKSEQPIENTQEKPLGKIIHYNNYSNLNNDLIVVSDDDDDKSIDDIIEITSNNDESESESESEKSESEEEESEEDEDESDEEENEDESDEEENDSDVDILEISDLNMENKNEDESDVEDITFNNSVKILKLEHPIEDNESTKNESKEDIFSNLKQIHIDGDSLKIDDSLDYKKMSVQKLRTIVINKGLAEDASKLKKHDILKLLEVE
jgi:hypothetical protein